MITTFLLGVIDHYQGFEMSFSIFYLIPVGFSGWFGGKKRGTITAIVSCLTWLLVDFTSGHTYTYLFLPFGMLSFVFVFSILSTFFSLHLGTG